MDENYKHTEITEKIIKSFYIVYNRLGYGFLEKIYENALMIELTNAGLDVKKQVPVKVFYDVKEVGNYFADINRKQFGDSRAKTGDGFAEEHEAQLTNYLRATKIEVGLLLNFGLKAQIKRKAFSNEHKKI
jgi:GxxExxY protein